MTPYHLRAAALASGFEAVVPTLHEFESAAQSSPQNMVLRALVLAVADRDRLVADLPGTVAGVRRDQLLRWDTTSSTWLGTDLEGRPALVRILDRHASPVVRRVLQRDAEALAGAFDHLRLGQEGLVATFDEDRNAPDIPAMWVTGAAGLLAAPWPNLSPEEMLPAGRTVHILCLTPGRSALRDNVRALASALALAGHDDELGRSMRTDVPDTPEHLRLRLAAGLRDSLVRRRVELVDRWRNTSHAVRIGRLHHAVERLQHSCPPPAGGGPVALDVDGQTVDVHCDGRRITWGPDAARVYDPADGFIPPEARRLIRARARSSHPEAARSDRITTWVAAALRLRTIRLLLESQASRASSVS